MQDIVLQIQHGRAEVRCEIGSARGQGRCAQGARTGGTDRDRELLREGGDGHVGELDTIRELVGGRWGWAC